jgi:predicted nucleotidyltransferase
MNETAGPPIPDPPLDVLEPVVYADAFDCAVTLDEIRRFARMPLDRDGLLLRLDEPSVARLLVERNGLYCLRDRPELIERRAPRVRRAEVLRRRARRVAGVLRYLPFVHALALTGSVAADDAGEYADVDMLVIVAAGRLGTVFALLGPASRILGRRLFCPNYYLGADHLELSPGSLYVARELSQARTLAGDAATLLRDANPWLAEVFPNLPAQPASTGRDGSRAGLQRLLEAPLRGRLGDRVERWARGLAAERLRAHYEGLGWEVPADVLSSLEAGVALRFHGRGVVEEALARFDARRAELVARLGHGDRDVAGAGSHGPAVEGR